MRKWERKKGLLRELDRPTDIYRWKTEIKKPDKTIVIDDKCHYKDDRQYITYRIQEIGKVKRAKRLEIPISYALLSHDQLVKEMLKCGYRNCEVFEMKDWPYYLVIAQV